MKAIKIIVKKFEKKAGGVFFTASCKGQYLPLVLADENTHYRVKFVSKELPQQEGIYSVSFEDKDLWIDTRPEYVGKNIVRVRPVKVLFDKKLVEKDIRA